METRDAARIWLTGVGATRGLLREMIVSHDAPSFLAVTEFVDVLLFVDVIALSILEVNDLSLSLATTLGLLMPWLHTRIRTNGGQTRPLNGGY